MDKQRHQLLNKKEQLIHPINSEGDGFHFAKVNFRLLQRLVHISNPFYQSTLIDDQFYDFVLAS